MLAGLSKLAGLAAPWWLGWLSGPGDDDNNDHHENDNHDFSSNDYDDNVSPHRFLRNYFCLGSRAGIMIHYVILHSFAMLMIAMPLDM